MSDRSGIAPPWRTVLLLGLALWTPALVSCLDRTAVSIGPGRAARLPEMPHFTPEHERSPSTAPMTQPSTGPRTTTRPAPTS